MDNNHYEMPSSASLEAVLRELEKEVSVVHLCARGARYATIRSLFEGDVVLAKVREINKHFHGDRKAAKTRGGSLYTESSVYRMHSSLIVSMYRRLIRSGMSDLEIYVKVHEEYAAQPPGGEILYDIDELIRLLRALVMGAIWTDRCPNCNSLVVMQASERSAEKCCPICSPRKQAKTKSQRPDIYIPPQHEIEAVAGAIEKNKRMAVELVLAGARPQEVDALVPGQEAYSRALWPRLLGRRAPQGSHTFNQIFYIETIERRRQTSYLVGKFKQLRKCGFSGPSLLLVLYRDYLQVYGNMPEPMNFSRIRFIVQLAATDELKQTKCPCCHGTYVILKDEIPGDQTCPVCRMINSQHKHKEDEAGQQNLLQVRDDGRIVCPLPGDAKRRRTLGKNERNLAF